MEAVALGDLAAILHALSLLDLPHGSFGCTPAFSTASGCYAKGIQEGLVCRNTFFMDSNLFLWPCSDGTFVRFQDCCATH